MVLDDDTDWSEVAELVTESYRLCAPQKLARLLDGSSGEGTVW
jgi:predicted DNA-binding protein (MmcQ/YjbR family)